jgi:hypothetical protein
MADDDGVDILILDKLTGQAMSLQVKTRTRTDGVGINTVEFGIRTRAFKDSHQSHLLGLLLDLSTLVVRRAWFIPASQMTHVGRSKRDKWIVRVSPEMTSDDECTPFRCETLGVAVARILREFDAKKVQRKGRNSF